MSIPLPPSGEIRSDLAETFGVASFNYFKKNHMCSDFLSCTIKKVLNDFVLIFLKNLLRWFYFRV
jgi:hypothetical protein